MLQLNSKNLLAMRDRLRERGAPASVAAPGLSMDDVESQMLIDEYGPLCETMFLMMVADGDVAGAERDVLRGALRDLDDRIRTAHVEHMITAAEKALGESSQYERIRAIGSKLREDPVRGEVAYVLATAIAFADDEIAPDENSLLNDLAEALGIDDAQSEALMRLLIR